MIENFARNNLVVALSLLLAIGWPLLVLIRWGIRNWGVSVKKYVVASRRAAEAHPMPPLNWTWMVADVRRDDAVVEAVGTLVTRMQDGADGTIVLVGESLGGRTAVLSEVWGQLIRKNPSDATILLSLPAGNAKSEGLDLERVFAGGGAVPNSGRTLRLPTPTLVTEAASDPSAPGVHLLIDDVDPWIDQVGRLLNLKVRLLIAGGEHLLDRYSNADGFRVYKLLPVASTDVQVALDRMHLSSEEVPEFLMEALTRPFFLSRLDGARSVMDAFRGQDGSPGGAIGEYLRKVMPGVGVTGEAADSLAGDEDDEYPTGVTDTTFVLRLLRVHGLLTAETLASANWGILTETGNDLGSAAAALYLLQETPEAQTHLIGSLKGANYRWSVEAMRAARGATFSEFVLCSLAADLASRRSDGVAKTRHDAAEYLTLEFLDSVSEFRDVSSRTGLIRLVDQFRDTHDHPPDWFIEWARLFAVPEVFSIDFADQALESPDSFIGWEAAAALRRNASNLSGDSQVSIEHAASGLNSEAICRALWVLGVVADTWAQPLIDRSLRSSDIFVAAAARRAELERGMYRSTQLEQPESTQSVARPLTREAAPPVESPLVEPFSTLSDLIDAGLVLPGDTLVRDHPDGTIRVIVEAHNKFRAENTRNCKQTYEEAAQRFIRENKFRPMKKVGGLAYWWLEVAGQRQAKLRDVAEKRARPE